MYICMYLYIYIYKYVYTGLDKYIYICNPFAASEEALKSDCIKVLRYLDGRDALK